MSVVHDMEMFSIFVVLGNQHYILMKVFSLVLPRKCGSFQMQKDNGQHSFLSGLCGQGILYPLNPHICTSVGYWMSFVFAWVLPQPSWRQMKSAPHFSFCTNPQSSGAGLE